jgi:tyrosinase
MRLLFIKLVSKRGGIMHYRRNVWELGGDWADPILWYARAVGHLKPKALADRTSWRFWAGMHGYHKRLWEFYDFKKPAEPLPSKKELDQLWLQCQHGSWFFLPWHRGYLIGFEKLIRATIVTLGGPGDWALPYWNYFKAGQDGLPPAFASPDWPDGKGTNPLFVEQRWGPDPDQPGKVFIPSGTVSLGALDQPEFTGVEGGGETGFGGIDTGFEHGGQSHGKLESDPHDQIHGLTGGEKLFPEVSPRPLPGLMSAPDTAGLDPIFWLHHANIDRLWETWRLFKPSNVDPTEPRWKDGPKRIGQRAFVVPLPDSSLWEYTPEQMADFGGLDYTYDDFAPALPTTAAAAAKPVTPQVAMATPIVEVVGSKAEAVPVVGKIAEAQVPLNAQMRAKVANRLGTAATLSTKNAPPEKVLLNLENVTGYSDATVLQVFVEFPGKDGSKSIERKVGSVGLFGITKATEANAGHGDGLSYVLDITKPYSEEAGSSNIDPASLTVRLLPVAPVHAASEVSIGRISIVRQGE